MTKSLTILTCACVSLLTACGTDESDPDAHDIPHANAKDALAPGVAHELEQDGMVDFFRIEVPDGNGRVTASATYTRTGLADTQFLSLSLRAEDVNYPGSGRELAFAGDMWTLDVQLNTALPDAAGGRYYLQAVVTSSGPPPAGEIKLPYTLTWQPLP